MDARRANKPWIKPNTAVQMRLISPAAALEMLLGVLMGEDNDPVIGDCLEMLKESLKRISDPKLAPLCLCCPQRVTWQTTAIMVLLVPMEETDEAGTERNALCNCLCNDCVAGRSEDELWRMVHDAYDKYAPGLLNKTRVQ